MSKNKELFKEAIADAKALREVAVANAKAALEESFAPRIQSMFEKRIMENEELEEAEEVDEVYVDDQDDLLSEEENIDLEELFNSLSEEDELAENEELEENEDLEENYDLEEILRELEEESLEENEELEENQVKRNVKFGNKGGIAPQKNLKSMSVSGNYKGPKEIRENEDMFEKATGDEGIDEVTVDELRDMIKDAIASALGNEGDAEGEEMDMPGDEMGGEDMEFDMDAAGAEGDEVEDVDLGIEDDEMEEKPAKKDKLKEDWNAATMSLTPDQLAMLPTYVGGLLASMVAGGAALANKDQIASAVKKAIEKLKGGASKPAMEARMKYKGTPAMDETADADADDLKEAIRVIKTLRNQLNEVNLLNAKLIYVNRIFKANQLTEGQKVNVVNSFDKAQTLTEAKNIFEVLKTTIKSKSAKTTLKESKSFASSVIGGRSAAPIIEADAQIERMKKLAGII